MLERERPGQFIDIETPVLRKNGIYFELERFKAERGWYNLNLTQQAIKALLVDQSWYCLQIPAEEMVGDSYEKVHLWEEIAVSLVLPPSSVGEMALKL